MAKFCQNCGSELNENQVVCLKCGCAVPNESKSQAVPGRKSKMAAGLLGIFLGFLGVHNFYLGNTSKAIAQLLISVVGQKLLN